MPGNRIRFYWDANCFLYYLNNDPKWASLLEYHLKRANDLKEIEIVTSVLSITEVAFTVTEVVGRALSSDEETRIEALWQGEGITFAEVNPLIARIARNLQRERLHRGWTSPGQNWRNPGAPDLLHLATAQFMQVSEMHTIEESLHRYSDIVNFRVCFPPAEPPILQPQLPLPPVDP